MAGLGGYSWCWLHGYLLTRTGGLPRIWLMRFFVHKVIIDALSSPVIYATGREFRTTNMPHCQLLQLIATRPLAGRARRTLLSSLCIQMWISLDRVH
jgi:hypothetical protein